MVHSIKYLVSALKEARKAKKLSQRELALKLGIPQSHISRIENAEVNITLSNFVGMARTLDLEVMLIAKKDAILIENIIASNRKGDKVRPAYMLDEDSEDD